MVEIPSHFFEHFLQDKACLALCSRHHSTGDTMPEDLQESVQQLWKFMPALEMNDTVGARKGPFTSGECISCMHAACMPWLINFDKPLQ